MLIHDEMNNIAAMPFKVGAQTVMHGYAAGLSFDKDPRLITEEVFEDVSERRKIRCFFRINCAAGIAALLAVNASGRKNERIKQAVNDGDFPAGNHGQRLAGAAE